MGRPWSLNGLYKARPAEYQAWYRMQQRCSNPDWAEFHNYGGRGIEVCERWRASFKVFLDDVGKRPSPEHSLDRIDNGGNYEPGNVRWATARQQSNNRRGNVRIEHDGESLTIAQWSRRLDIPHSTIRTRLKAGWPIAHVLSTKSHRVKDDDGKFATLAAQLNGEQHG